MVSKNFSEYKYTLEQYNQNCDNEKKSYRAVQLFFSFDIVNSSLYKDTNYLGWPSVLISLLTEIQKEINKELPSAQLWRVLGDEIIFFLTIKEKKEIYISIDAIYEVLIRLNKSLKTEKNFESIQNEYNSNGAIGIQKSNVLAVQSAAWLAIIVTGEDLKHSSYDNIFKKYRIDENQQINEFLGPDIDIGFRIKKETQDRRLVISVELAKILSDKTEYFSRLNIITYRSLKGVWQNRLYPIIWYHNENISKVSFCDSFYYDEQTYSELSKEYFLNRSGERGVLEAYMFEDTYKALEKIVHDQNLRSKLDEINRIIDSSSRDARAVENEFEEKLLEFHCAVVCCDLESKKVFIVKRKNRDNLNELWEFGCARASIERKLCDSIQEDYQRDFGLELELVCDKDRDDIEPVPIALYQVDKSNKRKNAMKLQKGVIVVGKIKGGKEGLDEIIQNSKKHEAYKWISEAEVEGFTEGAISDFKDTLKKVFTKWNEIFKES